MEPRNPIDEKSKKRLNNCSTLYNCHNQNNKKIQQKLFSEDIYTFSPVSLIDVCVLQGILFLVFVRKRAWHAELA